MGPKSFYYYENYSIGIIGYYTSKQLYEISKRYFDSKSSSIHTFRSRLQIMPAKEAVEDYRVKGTRTCRNCGRHFRTVPESREWFCENCRYLDDLPNIDPQNGRLIKETEEQGNEKWEELKAQERERPYWKQNENLKKIPIGEFDEILN